MTEVAEAVEADRKGKRANTYRMETALEVEKEVNGEISQSWYESWFPVYYKEYIKGSLEEEFADICIRTLDFAFEKFGVEMRWETYRVRVYDNWSFTDTADFLVRGLLNSGMMNLCEVIEFMYEWANVLNIDLDWHIEAKMRYNETRPYKHNNKAY